MAGVDRCTGSCLWLLYNTVQYNKTTQETRWCEKSGSRLQFLIWSLPLNQFSMFVSKSTKSCRRKWESPVCPYLYVNISYIYFSFSFRQTLDVQTLKYTARSDHLSLHPVTLLSQRYINTLPPLIGTRISRSVWPFVSHWCCSQMHFPIHKPICANVKQPNNICFLKR